MSSTLEILWIVIAFCALWVTAFFCWALYHIAMIARRVHIVMDDAKRALDQIEGAIHGVREKLDEHAGIIGSLVSLAGATVKEVKGRRGKKESV